MTKVKALVLLNFLKILVLLLIPNGNGLHPPQCQWSLLNDVDRLTCLVESGQNLIVEEEVYGIGPEHAKSLWVKCGESQLDPNSGAGFVLSHGVFMAVPNLLEFRLDNCRIAGITPGALSYLPNLQNLTIRAQTSLAFTWPTTTLNLEIKPGVFRGLPELRHLDLSTTSLTSLPSDFLCFLPALAHLNLTSCWLRDFRSIGIQMTDPTNPNAQSCGNQIRVLDLSGNHFTLLPPATFLSVSNLEELRLDLNSITLAAERALLGLNSLQIISLSGNQLTSLPPEFFKDNRLLREIYLQNNSLGVLAPGLFTGLEYLISLDLSSNDLTSDWVNGETFRGLVRLVVLNLSHNRLTRIDAVLFRDLYSLQVLNLENNKISHISEEALAGTYNLHTLLLSHNNLKTLDDRICKGLTILSFLALDNNKLEMINPDSFSNCSTLQDLNLSGNKLTSVPFAIGVLNYLRTLDLGENQINDIGNASYQRLPNLYGLRLTDNAIRTVSKESFLNLASLKIVNLAKNNITSVEAGTFDNNPNLQAIRLDSNRISNISGLFQRVPNLLWLNISANILTDLNYEYLPPRLQWLDLRSNRIETLGSCLLAESLRINKLDLSENLISELSSANLPDSIEKLSLRHNQISSVQAYTFFRKPNLTRIDLSHNQLTKIDQNALRLAPGRLTQVELLLAHNPLQCDCTMEWLQNIESQSDSTGHYPIILDGPEVKCSLSFERFAEPLPYMSVPSTQFLCKYESHCFSRCHCCDFDACDCEMSCPKNCSCYHDQGWSVNVVDCSALEQAYIPDRIPMDATELYLDGNVITSLDSHAFLGRKNLRALYLNASHIETLQNRSFHGLKQLQTLHLQNNFIERLEGFEFEDLDSLEELYLHQNSLSWIGNETFTGLHQLRVLWLHGNNFVDLQIWQVIPGTGNRVRSRLTDITLRGNEWSCECVFTLALREWLVENRARVNDAAQVQCIDQIPTGNTNRTKSSSSGSELMVVRILEQKNHRCSQSTDLSVIEPSSDPGVDWSEYLPLILVLSALLIILLVLFSVSFYWRQTLRVWFHAKCGLRLTSCGESLADRDKLFDAFVSYSSKDEAWVRQVLAAELERHEPPYRLCLRYRDLPTGGTYLADTIVQASEASRRTVLVLSHHFLKGEWSRTDVKSAHHSVLKDRHRQVIIILLGDLPSKDLDPDVRLYLKTHTYLSSEDKRFWDKLYYALPDVKVKVPLSRGLHNRTNNSNSNNSHSHSHTHTHSHFVQNPTPQPQIQPPMPLPQQQPQLQQPQPQYQHQHRPQPPPPIPPSQRHPPINANPGTPPVNVSNSGPNPNRHVAIHI